MKHQVLDQIFNKTSAPRKFERLELDWNFHIIKVSEQVQRFADRPEEVKPGKDIRLCFPEFIGLEDILVSILLGEQELFQLEGIGRVTENQCDIYFDIYIISEQQENTTESRLIILMEEVTEKMVLKQNVAQKVNEASLLSSALTAYKNYMDKVITSMADALIVTTSSGKIKTVNRAAEELFGYSTQELINQQITLVIDENQLWQINIQQHFLARQCFQNLEVVCRTKTQEKVLIAFSCTVIQNKIEGLEDIVYVGRDITARQRRQQRNCAQYAITRILSESQNIKQAMPQILQAICESLEWDLGELWTSSQYIATSTQRHSNNPVLRCVEIWSSRAVNAREFKGITWQTTYTPGVGLPGLIWETRSPHWLRDILQDGDLKRSQPAAAAGLHAAFGFPILDDNEIFGVMIFFSRDVQLQDEDLLQMMVSIGSQIAHFLQHKRASELLLESEERYRDLFENANDLIQSVTPYGRFEYVNRAWQETLGYNELDIAQMNLFDIIHPDYQAKCRQLFYRAMTGEKLEQVTIAFVTKDNKKIFVEGNINCKFVGGKPVATRGIFHNITQRLVAEEALRQQQEQTERLLLNILPEAIANRLKLKPGTIAEDFADVTVLFADIVGFTKLASELSAIKVVNLLNQIFSTFDRLSEKYHLEKIKIIGDAYMVVGGLPTRRSDHAHAIAHMALDMQTAIAQFNEETQHNLNIRIGINTGAVVAGVIGIKKFTYDLWGDTVNIASRMESHGLTGKIQVTEATYNRLRDEFVLERRGEIEVKGKGKMTTYLLLGRRRSQNEKMSK
ncbi:MAG: adenylate/guanylate cyclase domain-containing protein [Heteroscytonema crispum UTEX LB 1556]